MYHIYSSSNIYEGHSIDLLIKYPFRITIARNIIGFNLTDIPGKYMLYTSNGKTYMINDETSIYFI